MANVRFNPRRDSRGGLIAIQEIHVMAEQFSEQVRAVFELARQEAAHLNHNFVGTEHLLLALLQETTGLSGEALKMLGLDAGEVRHEVEKLIARGPTAVSNDNLPFTPRAKRVIEYAQQEAMLVNQKQISADHLLLGLFREPDGVAARVLENLGFELTEVRAEVLKIRLEQMKLVERIVRPVRAGIARKRKMREELLAHLESIYTEELSRLSDPAEALKAAAKRFGDSSELAREFQKSLPASQRVAARIERWFGWRAGESAERFVLRQALLTFVLMGLIICLPATYLLLKGAALPAWSGLRIVGSLVGFTAVSQFLLGVLYLRLRDALLGPPWAVRSRRRAMLIDLLIVLSVLACGFGFVALGTADLEWAVQGPVFFIIGLLTVAGYHLLARSRGPLEIADTCWASLSLD
jgi:Clp amino terminal domain, pathogenicity island component